MPEIRNAEVIEIRDEIPPQYAQRNRENIVEVEAEPIDAQFVCQSGNGYDDQGLSGGLGNLFRGRSFVPEHKKRQAASRPGNLHHVPHDRSGFLQGLETSLTSYASANPGTTLLVLGGVAVLAGILLKRK